MKEVHKVMNSTEKQLWDSLIIRLSNARTSGYSEKWNQFQGVPRQYIGNLWSFWPRFITEAKNSGRIKKKKQTQNTLPPTQLIVACAMTTYRMKKQHLRNWCFKRPVKAKPSFSSKKLHVWAAVTTIYYSTSYTLIEPSGASHDFSDQNYFPEYLRIAVRLTVERKLFIPREPSPRTTPACSSPGKWCYSRNTNIAVWLFPWPWNTSTEALHPPSSSGKAEYSIPNWLSSSGVFTSTGGEVHGHSSPAFLNSR